MIFTLPKKHNQPVTWPTIPLRWVFTGVDLLTLAVMMGTFLNEFQDTYQYAVQGLAALLVLVYLPLHMRFRLRMAPEFYLAGLFVAWSFSTGMLLAKDDELVLAYAIRIARFVALVIAVGGLAMVRKDPSRGFMVMICLGIFLCILTKTSGIYLELVEGKLRYGSLGLNPNTVGVTLLWGIVSIVFLWGTSKSYLFRGALCGAFMVFAFFLITTASRKSFVSLLFFIALWLLFCYGKKIIKNTAVFALALLVSFGAYYVSSKVVPETLLGKRLLIAKKEGSMGESRDGMYIEGWKMFLEKPIAGVGLGNFIIHSKFKQYSHSDYIEALSTTGAVGFVLYFSIYFILWRRINAVRRRTNDARIHYQMGLYQALILTFFAIGIGTIHFLSLTSWFLLALMTCHTTALERSLSSVGYKRPRPGNSFSLQRGMRRSA